MLLTPAALWLVEKGRLRWRPAILALNNPGWTAAFFDGGDSGALHAVHDHADNRRDDRPRHAAADQLADKGADVHAIRSALQHRDERGQERPACRPAQSAGDGVAGGSQIHILRRRADRVAADRASNELDDKVDNRARHGVSSVMATKSHGRYGNKPS